MTPEEGDALLATSERLTRLREMAEGQKDQAEAKGWSPTMAEQLAMRAFDVGLASLMAEKMRVATQSMRDVPLYTRRQWIWMAGISLSFVLAGLGQAVERDWFWAAVYAVLSAFQAFFAVEQFCKRDKTRAEVMEL